MPRIFISYARKDGKALAAQLRRRLVEDHGFGVWQDLSDMEGGAGWWRQITEAIDHVEYLVLVMTGAAAASSAVRDEWMYARRHGVCVIPVKGEDDLDISALAGWMRRSHFVDPNIPEQWKRFVRTLEGPCQVARVPMMAESPPADFVARTDEFTAIATQLLKTTDGEPVAITAAFKGAGGYGKTTLARAVCHDPAIQDAFDGGIAWVTLGEAPGDLGAKLEDLIVTLSGEPSHLSSLESRKGRLSDLLRDRRLLLVIDDVWNAAHLEPFLSVRGSLCAVLVTTRNSDTLPAGLHLVAVDAMRETEALSLLRHGLPEGQEADLAGLARRLGEWPLLLKLANGALRDRIAGRDTLRGAIGRINIALDRRGLTAFDASRAADRFPTFEASDIFMMPGEELF